jgi:hypothetical protein
VLLGIGVIGLIGFLIIALIGGAYLADLGPDEYDTEEQVDIGTSILVFCTPMIFIPSFIFFFFGYRGYRREKKLKGVVEILRAYRNIHIAEVGRKLGKSEAEAEIEIMKCLSEDLIRGYIDPATKKFIITEVVPTPPGYVAHPAYTQGIHPTGPPYGPPPAGTGGPTQVTTRPQPRTNKPSGQRREEGTRLRPRAGEVVKPPNKLKPY